MRWGIRSAVLAAGCGLASLVVAQETPKADPEQYFKLADENGDGKLSLEEFIKFSGRNPALKDKQDLLKQAFNRLDTNKDGFIDAAELKVAQSYMQMMRRRGPAKTADAKTGDKSPAAQPVFQNNGAG